MNYPERNTVVCVGAVVLHEGRVLLVRQAQGHSLAGQWSLPWGFLDDGESPSACAVRETLEEAGVEAEVVGLLAVQEMPQPWAGSIGLVYLCHAGCGACGPDGRETDAAAFFSRSQLYALEDPVEPWCKWLALRVLTGRHTVIAADPGNPYAPCPGFP